MSRLPLDPSLARTLLAADDAGVAHTAATVCALVCGEEVFCRAGGAQTLDAARATREEYEASGEGDQMTLLNIYDAWRGVPADRAERWCTERGVHSRALRAAREAPRANRPPSALHAVTRAAASQVRSQLVSMLRQATSSTIGESRAEPADGRADAGTRAAVRRAVCEGHFMKAARRMGASSIFMTVREPSQTVHTRGARQYSRP